MSATFTLECRAAFELSQINQATKIDLFPVESHTISQLFMMSDEKTLMHNNLEQALYLTLIFQRTGTICSRALLIFLAHLLKGCFGDKATGYSQTNVFHTIGLGG